MTQRRILLPLLGIWSSLTSAKVLRVYEGEDDVNNRYPFAVSLGYEEDGVYQRECTGSLIAAEWVLSAGHCIVPTTSTLVRFGDLTVPHNETNSYRKVFEVFPHPHYQDLLSPLKFSMLMNDIGLILIEKLEGVKLATVSGLDYKSLSGLPVTYAGFGMINYDYNDIEWLSKPLQIGNGVIANCNPSEKEFVIPGLCVTHKCNTMTHMGEGDSGGPLMFRDTIIGVASAMHIPTSIFCPVSPYLEWINNVMLANHCSVMSLNRNTRSCWDDAVSRGKYPLCSYEGTGASSVINAIFCISQTYSERISIVDIIFPHKNPQDLSRCKGSPDAKKPSNYRCLCHE